MILVSDVAISVHPDIKPVETTQTGSLMDRPDSPYTNHVDDSVLQISGAGHWFLEGWIGDHSVEFLVDSGSSITAMSDSLYQTLVQTGAPVGAFGYTSRTLRGANGTRIGVSGCSHCVVSFMGLQTFSGLLEGLTLFAENTGLIVGRTLVDRSRWKVPVLVSNFSQDTVVVAPFS